MKSYDAGNLIVFAIEVSAVDEGQSLLEVVVQLKEAIERSEWDEAKKIDDYIKLNIKQAVSDAEKDSDKADLIDLLSKVQSLYKHLIANTEESRSKLSLELKQITNDRKVANFYLKSSLYK